MVCSKRLSSFLTIERVSGEPHPVILALEKDLFSCPAIANAPLRPLPMERSKASKRETTKQVLVRKKVIAKSPKITSPCFSVDQKMALHLQISPIACEIGEKGANSGHHLRSKLSILGMHTEVRLVSEYFLTEFLHYYKIQLLVNEIASLKVTFFDNFTPQRPSGGANKKLYRVWVLCQGRRKIFCCCKSLAAFAKLNFQHPISDFWIERDWAASKSEQQNVWAKCGFTKSWLGNKHVTLKPPTTF